MRSPGLGKLGMARMLDAIRSTRPSDAIATAADPRPRRSRTPPGDPNRSATELGERAPPGGVGVGVGADAVGQCGRGRKREGSMPL